MLLRAVAALLREVVEQVPVDRGLALSQRVHRLHTARPALLAGRRVLPHDPLLLEDAADRVEPVRAHRVDALVAGVDLLVPVAGDALDVGVARIIQTVARFVRFEASDPQVLRRDVALRHLELDAQLLQLVLHRAELLALDDLARVLVDEGEVALRLGAHEAISAVPSDSSPQ